MNIRFKLSHIPNTICILRIVIVIPIIIFLWNKQHLNALLLIAIAGLSDFLDGFLAKTYNWNNYNYS